MNEENTNLNNSLEEQKELENIFSLLHNFSGVDFSNYRQTTVMRRISRRMGLHKLSKISEYSNKLIEDSNELSVLYKDLLLSFTEFFRDPLIFDILKKDIFPKLIKNKTLKEPLRIWIPACSTGEEAYSIAISLYEFLEENNSKINIQIFATDLVENNIVFARAACYPNKIKKDLSNDRLERFFDTTSKGLKVAKFIREMVVFAAQDLTQDPPFPKIDLVSCRNVLIYFNEQLQKIAIPLFHFALNPNGFLMLGSSETLGKFSNLFVAENQKANIYSKIESTSKQNYNFPVSSTLLKYKSIYNINSKTDIKTSKNSIKDLLNKVLLDSYTPPCILVDANMNILQFHGNTSPYMAPANGDASLKLSKMAEETLMPDIYVAIEEAKKSNKKVIKKNISFTNNKLILLLDISIVPIQEPERKSFSFLIIFEKKDNNTSTYDNTDKTLPEHTHSEELVYLRSELKKTKDHLQSIIEEKEDVNQDLWTANEEIQSTNEELQSVNEEMEAAKEELEASNEELIALNEELHKNNIEVGLAKEFAENLLETANTLIVTLDINGNITTFNKYAEFLTGYKKEEVLSKNWFDIFIPIKIKETMPLVFKDALTNMPSVSQYDNTILTRDRKEILISWSNNVLSDSSGDITGILSIGKDITKSKQMEKQIRQSDKMLAIGQLAGGIAHDFNNQLSGVMGCADLIKKYIEPNSKISTYVDNIIKSTDHAADLTKKLLAFARKGKYLSISVNIHSVIDDVISLLTHTINKKINIVKKFSADNCNIIGDPSQIQNALLNLGINARDAMPSGGNLTITSNNISIVKNDTNNNLFQLNPGNYLTITLSDTGVGIDKEFLGKIFEPFFTTKQIGDGSGMGLASVYGTIQNHKGFIDVDSTIGQGTSFKIFLPTVIEKEKKIISIPKPVSNNKEISILLVDDEPLIRTVGSEVLADMDFMVYTASNGLEALEFLNKNPDKINLVILDVIMPKMDGHECFAEIKKIDPSMKILISSGYSIEGVGQDILDAGADGFIQKPFRAGLLIKNVNDILNN